MSLTRAMLRQLGVTEKETIDAIMEAHGTTVETLKERNNEVEKTLKEKITALESSMDADTVDEWKRKFEAEKQAHEATKDGYKIEKLTTAQNKALQEALKSAGANEKLIPLLIDKLDRTKAVFDGDTEKGFKIKNTEDIIKPIKEQFSEVFGKVTTQGVGAANPLISNQNNTTAKYKSMNEFIRGHRE